MTPSLAIHNSIFQTYLILVAAILTVAGVVLLLVQKLFHRDVLKIWLTYRSWLVMIPLIALAVLLGRWGVIVGCALLSLAGVREFAHAAELGPERWIVFLLIVGVAAATSIARFDLFMLAPLCGTCVLLLLPILKDRTSGQLRIVATSLFAFILTGWMFPHLAWLANSSNPYGYLLYILFAAEINDVSAFTFGRMLGRHKLRPNISPAKTWEGAIGALCVSMALPWLLRFSFPMFEPRHLILTGLIVGVGGQTGDLAMSLIKRDLGVKDMGSSIPGHGGILDRIDSLIFIAPLFVHMIRWTRSL